MRKCWSPETPPEIIPAAIDPEHYQQLLAEISKILYDYFCQLDKDHSFFSSSIGPQSSVGLDLYSSKRRSLL